MKTVVDILIGTSPEAAFDAMADARGEVHWNSRVSRSDLRSAEPIGLGSRFETVNGGQVFDASITRYERPRSLTFGVTGKQMDISADFDFRPEGTGCRLTASYDFRPKGATRLMFPLLAPMIRRGLRTETAAFGAYAEQVGDPSTSSTDGTGEKR